MLFTLGERTKSGDVVALLLGCHQRVREHLALARRVANAPESATPASISAAAARVRTYFRIAFPLHRQDEEIDIFPRLSGIDAELDAAIDELIRDHEAHDHDVERLIAICADLERDPSLLPVRRDQLADVVRLLDTELASHLTLEERTVFLALGRLSALAREKIHQAMRARR